MFRAGLLAGLLIAALVAACGDSDGELAAGEGGLALRLEREDDRHYLRWEPQEGAAVYKISGSATYWPMCVGARPEVVDDVSFNNLLAKDVVEYAVPKASGEGFYLRELTAEVAALDEEQVAALQEGPDVPAMAEDGLAYTAESTPC